MRPMFDLQKKRVLEYIGKGKYRRVLLQFPEGLKPQGFKLAREIERESGAEVIVSADACYGACDLAVEARDQLMADALVHYGHSPMNNGDAVNIFFVEARASESIDAAVKKALELLRDENRIGLTTVVQHVDQLEHAAGIVRDSGKEPFIGKASGHAKYPGQILGCDYSTATSIATHVDSYIFIGGGNFHAIGIELATGKRTIVADPYLNQARDMTETTKLLLRKRWATITKFQDSKKVGIVIGLKTGQKNIESARTVKSLLEIMGKECVLLSAIECTPENLESFVDINAFVTTACPRLAIDDQERFTRPILNTEEVVIAAGKKRWEDYGRYVSEQKTA
jgi:2-(3-amino-3-carboxypropyl)histidine synthase